MAGEAGHVKDDWTLRDDEIAPGATEAVRGGGYDASMFDEVPREGSRVPPEIADAEEWRVLGEKLRSLAPELYGEVLTALAAVAVPPDEPAEKIT